MKKTSEKIVFFGSGPVAAASLASLVDAFEIELVITKRPPSYYRGAVPVVELAKKLQLNVEFANTLQELDDLTSRVDFKSRVGVIVDYGVIVSQSVIDIFPLGIINSHFSLLPEWRGADPITFTVLSGQDETGVSLMTIVEQLDEGYLIAQEKLSISPLITTPELTNQLISKSNEMLVHYLPDYIDGKIKPYSQSKLSTTYSRKLTKADGLIDWDKPAIRLEREIRAYLEWPKSTTTINNKKVIITKASVISGSGKPGDIEINGKNLIVYTGENALRIEKLKPAGKNEMTSEAFITGYRTLLD